MRVNEKPRVFEVELLRGAIVKGEKTKKGAKVKVGKNDAHILRSTGRGRILGEVKARSAAAAE